jgi:undecaprenyl pyrophosphate phosphatase UppP
MVKLLLFTILILFVYQFDDVLRGLHLAVSKIRNKKYKQLVLDSDRYVAMAMTIIGMPLALNYMLTSDHSLGLKFLYIGLTFLIFGILISGIGIFMKRLKHLSYYENVNMFAGSIYAIAGLFHPVMNYVPWHSGRDRVGLARFAMLLSIPPLVAILFRAYYDQYSFQAEFLRYIDVLLVVLVGALFMLLTIRMLSRFLIHSNLNLAAYMRVVIGIGIVFALFIRP